MVLSGSDIQESVSAGLINIEPFDPALLKPASYTFTLGAEYSLVPKMSEIDGRIGFEPVWRALPDDGLLLLPGDFVLGRTRELVALRGRAVCLISTRSAMARMGLSVTQGSFFAEPDTNRSFVLEISNGGPTSVRLAFGQKIAHGVFIQ